jgi:cobalamin-dependent methionine synthase I
VRPSDPDGQLDGTLPLVAQHGCPVIALLLDDAGLPADVDSRMVIGRRLLERTRRAGVPDDRVYVDPLALTLGTVSDGALVALETIRSLRSENPEIRFSIGLSNVSFGLPARTLVNQAFLAQLLAAGLDAAILNPMEQGLMNMLYATELVLGRDRYCRGYIRAYRAGKVKLDSTR